nr:WD-40 repeat-containing protein MSI1-like [Ipomoea batatas]
MVRNQAHLFLSSVESIIEESMDVYTICSSITTSTCRRGGAGDTVQKLIIGTCAAENEQNNLLLAQVRLPRNNWKEDIYSVLIFNFLNLQSRRKHSATQEWNKEKRYHEMRRDIMK